MYGFIQRNKGKFLMLIVLGAIIGASAVTIAQEGDLPPTQTLTVNQTKTIGEVTVDLQEIKYESGVMEVKHSARSTGAYAYQIGLHALTFSDGDTIRLHTGRAEAKSTTEISYFVLGERIPGIEDGIDVDLGSYLVERPDLFGSTRIDLPKDFETLLEFGKGEMDISVDGELFVDYPYNQTSDQSSQYRISKITVFRKPTARQFDLTLVPVNAASKKMALASAGPDKVTLKDDVGNEYNYSGTGVNWDLNEEIQHIKMHFNGIPSPYAAYFKLQVQGGAESLGPFVFENIALVSEDIPPVTPVPPGGVGLGDPNPTPPNVNN